MYENIDFDNIDLTQNPPQEEPDRQYYYIAKARQYVQEKSRKKGRPLTFCVNTFGCQMNARDSEKLIGILEQIGYVKKETEDADFVIYNTCTVRENANNKVYGRLGYLHSQKKKESGYDDRALWLHDAGAGSCRKDTDKLSFCGSGIWNA